MSIKLEPQVCDDPKCDGEIMFYEDCGAYVCDKCDTHIGLARCYCGWSKTSPGQGQQELIDMGETIGEPGEGFFD